MNILHHIASCFRFKEVRVLLYTQTGQDVRYTVFRVFKKKGEAVTEALEPGYTPLPDKRYFPTGVPVVLSLQGNGLVQRVFAGNVAGISTRIPNFNDQEFYLQHSEFDFGKTYAALFRRDGITKIVSELAAQDILINRISLGFADFVRFQNVFPDAKKNLFVGEHRLELDGNKISAVRKESPESPFRPGYPDSDEETVATGAALSFFFETFREQEDLPCIENNIRELIAAGVNKLIIKYILPCLLGILLINFLLFDHLDGMIQEKDLAMAIRKESVVKIEQLKKEIQSEKEFAKKVNFGQNQAFAFYADRLAALNVPGVRFEELTVHPVGPKIRQGEPVSVETGTILLRGTCSKADDFSSLLVKINSAPWAEKIEKQSYMHKSETGLAIFELLILYKKRPDEIKK